MILSAWTVTALFLALVSAAVAAAGLVVAGRAALRGRTRAHGDRAARWDADGPLLGLLLGVLVALRLVALPVFYLLLDSYVPALAEYGVMCAFGVTRIEPGLVRAVQVLGPIVLFLGGLWLLLASSSAAPSPAGDCAHRVRAPLAALTAALALAQCAVEVRYLLADKVGRPVTCCTQFLETEAATPAGAGGLVRGLQGHPLLFAALQVALLAGTAVVLRRLAAGRREPGRIGAVAVGLLGLVSLPVTAGFWRDELAPRVLGLPYHRCVYELLTDTRALGLAALLALLAVACVVWPPLLRGTPGERATAVGLYRAALLFHVSSLLVVAVHLV